MGHTINHALNLLLDKLCIFLSSFYENWVKFFDFLQDFLLGHVLKMVLDEHYVVKSESWIARLVR